MVFIQLMVVGEPPEPVPGTTDGNIPSCVRLDLHGSEIETLDDNEFAPQP